MKNLLAILAAAVLLVSLAGAAAAADDALDHTGRFIFVAGGDVDVPADEQADAVLVIGGDASVAGTVNALIVVNGTATLTGATVESLTIIAGEANLVAGSVAQQRAEDDRHARGEQEHHAEMTRHRLLRPVARSTASSSTSAFNRPLTMRNVLPYS